MKNGDKCEVVNLKNITKRYGGVTALNNVNFSVVSGEINNDETAFWYRPTG
jgi:ABC-type sugar transport system ATPase subunit